MDPRFWRGKRVFLTGHTGFKGAWLSVWLQQLGAQVFGYSLAPQTTPSLHVVAEVACGMAEDVTADIRDAAALAAALRRARPEVVIHMAAQAIVLHGYDHPADTFATNVMGTVLLLDAIRALDSVRAVVVVTSDKCYENTGSLWGHRETDPMGGLDPYSASKAAAELAVAAMRHSYFHPDRHRVHGVGLASARAGNVIGGGDWSEHRLVPDLMRGLMTGTPCAIRNPAAVRPWQHVLESLSGYLCLAEALWREGPGHAGGWNFGPRESDARPVSWVADRLGELWGGAPAWSAGGAVQRHESHHLRLDIAKARSELGWSPVWSLDTALVQIVDWYRAYVAGAAMRECVVAQIEQFRRDAERPAAAERPAVRVRELLGDA